MKSLKILQSLQKFDFFLKLDLLSNEFLRILNNSYRILRNFICKQNLLKILNLIINNRILK